MQDEGPLVVPPAFAGAPCGWPASFAPGNGGGAARLIGGRRRKKKRFREEWKPAGGLPLRSNQRLSERLLPGQRVSGVVCDVEGIIVSKVDGGQVTMSLCSNISRSSFWGMHSNWFNR